MSYGSPLVAEALSAIYDGDRHIDRFPSELIESIAPLTKVGKFSHGEIDFAGTTVIRIDDYLAAQTEKAIRRISGLEDTPDVSFEGVSFGIFDGVLKEMDSRGVLVRGKLILTAGGREIECIFKRDDIPALRETFERRARIEAVAHYDGVELLPVRLDVKKITPVVEIYNFGRWRGALAGRKVRRPEGL